MEHAFTLVVLTLLHSCRGQSSQPEWFAANSISDQRNDYTPKPITEIFTSDSPFTSKNPALFTQPTTSTTSTQPPSSKPTPIEGLQTGNSAQNGRSPSTPDIMSQVMENPRANDLPNFLIVFDPRGQINLDSQPPVVPLPSPKPTQATASANIQPMAAVPSQSTNQIPSTQGTLLTVMPAEQPQIGYSQQNVNPPQNANSQQFGTPQQIGNPQQILNLSPPAFQPSQQPIQIPSISPSRWPLLVYTVQAPSDNPSVYTTPLPTQTIPTAPSTIAPNPRPVRLSDSKPMLTVRVKAPKGSITNIRINPTSTVRPMTTRRRKPTTRRIMNYDACISTCNGKKEPICSSPVGLHPINPDKLKGFPSLCHMACNNSFKKDLYEKVTDGRCGRLRTRIRPVDKKKLNKEELNKAQYTIVHNVPDTVLEFSPVKH